MGPGYFDWFFKDWRKKMELFITIVKTVGVIICAYAALRKISFEEKRIFKGKYSFFKTIRKDYSKDKINGCFAIQHYFKRYLHEDEIEYILNSTDAYKIFSLLKAAWGKYEFKDNKYTLKVTGIKYALPFIGSSISYILLTFQIVFYDKILAMGINLHDYLIILIVNICINGPLLITCSTSISGINCARKLAKITNTEAQK
jgi:hypothetical protein